jgi:hypothetical protein
MEKTRDPEMGDFWFDVPPFQRGGQLAPGQYNRLNE